jgi:prepilin-type N-terminal cleavage/methylation domain-containing protein
MTVTPKQVRLTRGFTLIEIMVSLGLLSAILAGTMSAMITFSNSTQANVQASDMQDNARRSLEVLEADLRSAGVGSSNGTVGIAPSGAWTARIPTIFTGPALTYKDPSNNNYTLTSLYIIGAEPATLGPTVSGDGVLAVITSPSGVQLTCTSAAGAYVQCNQSSVGADGLEHQILLTDPTTSTFFPLLVHDHQRASIISPTAVSGTVAAGSRQTVTFAESGGALGPISPDPSAPFGFAQGFQVSRARVIHWYLKQATGQPPRLYRSRPALTTGGGSCANPFLDETNGGAIVGVEMGAGPIESLQFRFMFDSSQQDDPTKYDMISAIDPCDTNAPTRMRQLREVRIQMVAISSTTQKDTSGTPVVSRFTTPVFEGTAIGAGKDKYPRRAYVSRIAPRNIQPYRL